MATEFKLLHSHAGSWQFMQIKKWCFGICAFLFCSLLLPGSVAIAQAPASVLSDRVDFIAVDGSLWSMARSADNFLLVGKDNGRPPFISETMACVDRNMTLWNARWDGANFLLAAAGMAQPARSEELQCLDWKRRPMRIRWDAPARKFRILTEP